MIAPGNPNQFDICELVKLFKLGSFSEKETRDKNKKTDKRSSINANTSITLFLKKLVAPLGKNDVSLLVFVIKFFYR